MRELLHPHPQCSRACRPDGVDAKQREATHDGSTQHGRCHLSLSCGRLPKGNRSCGHHASHPRRTLGTKLDFAPAAARQKAECRVPSSSWSTSTSTWATQVLLAIAGQSRPILTPGIVMSQGSACGVDSPSCIHAGVGGDTDERCRYCGNVLRARARLLAGSRTPRAGRIDARQRRCVLCVRALCCECLGFQFSHARLHAQARCVNSIQHPRCMRLPLHPRARRSGEA